ncbi:MAG: metallopeptidase family protein [Candidatus Levybacteria bacterium]|nr:metallopeptidase family protein [Candidatus Levybacteria bacterium]
MNDSEFEKIVQDGIKSIPKEFLERLSNIAITIEDTPSEEQIKKFHLAHGFTLFGLYEGVPGTVGTGLMPSKITIFKDPIVSAAHNEDDMKEIVKHTVWHEIAHAFGMDEDAVRFAETERQKKKR